jgi:hypothetical protein
MPNERILGMGVRSAIGTVRGFLWKWDVVAVGAIAILIGGGVAAIYGDDFNIATGMFFVAIIWLATKAISWEEVKGDDDRVWISIVIAAMAIACIAGVDVLD